MRYIECIDGLKSSLNFRSTDEEKAKNNKRVFNMCLTVLKDDFKTDLTTKFLRGLVEGDEKQKSNRVTYMLREIGLKNRVKVTDCYFEKFATLTEKNAEILVYKSKLDDNGNEQISCHSAPLTSHDEHGVKRPCKVGVLSCKLKQISLNQIQI